MFYLILGKKCLMVMEPFFLNPLEFTASVEKIFSRILVGEFNYCAVNNAVLINKFKYHLRITKY